jgi:hypothetical protein
VHRNAFWGYENVERRHEVVGTAVFRVMSGERSRYSAAEPGLGYIYQGRFALLKILSLPETTAILIEKEDDIEFIGEAGVKSLGSLKHKAMGDSLTDLSTDFWKSVRIWLSHYMDNGRMTSDTRFFLFTTADISASSFLMMFTEREENGKARAKAAYEALEKSRSKTISSIRSELERLTDEEQQDFYGRITIIDSSPRITQIPNTIIDQHLRTIRKESRSVLFERLEGWWTDLVIKILSGERTKAVLGYEVSDKLSSLAEEYRSDNLPITFRNRLPDGKIDIDNDPRLFVEQLRVLDLSPTRIQNAIIDYYRAFEQRSSWARETLLISGEIEDYENKLVDEWTRYREVVFENMGDVSEDESCIKIGRELYRWAEMETTSLRIRERVTEPYVVRGTFHILANARPRPRVYWHPRFLKRLAELLGVAA